MIPNYVQHTTNLYHIAHHLLNIDDDTAPLYADDFCKLNSEVLILSDMLFNTKGETPEEEAELCVALLMGYNATIYGVNKEAKKQAVLDRSFAVMNLLPDSLLKSRLLLSCYDEILEEELKEEAQKIADNLHVK